MSLTADLCLLYQKKLDGGSGTWPAASLDIFWTQWVWSWALLHNSANISNLPINGLELWKLPMAINPPAHPCDFLLLSFLTQLGPREDYCLTVEPSASPLGPGTICQITVNIQEGGFRDFPPISLNRFEVNQPTWTQPQQVRREQTVFKSSNWEVVKGRHGRFAPGQILHPFSEEEMGTRSRWDVTKVNKLKWVYRCVITEKST